MRVLILGIGVIGSTYGYVFQKAGHTVEHLVRPEKRALAPQSLDVKLLDGRRNQKGVPVEDAYRIVLAEPGTAYDVILVSVSSGVLKGALETIDDHRMTGTVLVMSGLWEDRPSVEGLMAGRPYLLGYPVAGGTIASQTLDCVLFDHIMLEGRERARVDNYEDVGALFESAGIALEVPYDLLEWIWLHMAINAGVIAVAAHCGEVAHPSEAARTLMGSAKLLGEAVLAIRETTKIVASRGVDRLRYLGELLPYYVPVCLAGPAMKRMFASNELTRRIMELHGNPADLLYVCRCVYACGRENHISAERYYRAYRDLEQAVKRIG